MQEQTQTIQRIGPVRGIVYAHNAEGRALGPAEIERWLRLNRTVYKCDKIDLLIRGSELGAFSAASQFASTLDLKLSLRTDCSCAPPTVEVLRSAAPLDLFLCPAAGDYTYLGAWIDAAKAAALPFRAQLHAPFEDDFDAVAFAERIQTATAVQINANDPFTTAAGARNAAHTAVTLQKAMSLATTLVARKIETSLVSFPFCVLPESLWPQVVNRAQLFRDHQFYKRESFELAASLFPRSPAAARMVVLSLLGQHTSTNNPIDRILLPWLMDRPWVRARIWALHKVTRHRKTANPSEPAAAEREIANRLETRRRARGPICGACKLQRICDGYTHLETRLHGLTAISQPGEEVIDPMAYAVAQHKQYDEVDAARLHATEDNTELAKAANEIVTNMPPSREIDSFDYKVEGTWSWQLPGSLRWFSFVGGEKISTPIAKLDPPFTLSVTFGGGVADYIGFALGRACRLLCPMTAYMHRVVLHVDADGRYVLLRDGQPMQPVEFVGAYYAPPRLGRSLEPRIAAWNIDGTIGTQAVMVWSDAAPEAPVRAFKVSIVIVSTRYSRRLQACLRNLAHQQGIPLSDIEVVIAFVPGLDATNDVLDSMQLTYPELTIVPAPFAAAYANTKGLLLNECLDKVRGEWVMVLDADILLAPDMLARLTALPEDCKFAIPDGRKMLTRELTARVLLGEVKAWESWEDLVGGPGEYRQREADGVPVGYCQCVRRECLEKVRYEELHHFEGADWKFGKDMRDLYGMEKRLDGVPVLHLDHGSSNWYGASRHY